MALLRRIPNDDQLVCPLCDAQMMHHTTSTGNGMTYCPTEIADSILDDDFTVLDHYLGELLMHLEGCVYYHSLLSADSVDPG